MSPLTNIADQLTPGHPIEIVYEASTGIPSANQEILLIGHMKDSGAGSGTATVYAPIVVNNVTDLVAASGEVATKFGDGSELAKMVLAAVKVNSQKTNSAAIRCIPLALADTDFGSTDQALLAADKLGSNFIVSCYDGTSTALRNKLRDRAIAMSQPGRVDNGQYGCFGVVANSSVTDPSLLPVFDNVALIGYWLRDTSPTRLIGEKAAAFAAVQAGNPVPFNPLDSETVPGIDAPTVSTDPITVGAGAESETCLNKGWTPVKVTPTGELAMVRTVSGRVTTGDSVTRVTAYFDVQDIQVLYFWRKTLATRWGQEDMRKRKASSDTGEDILSEAVRLAGLFEDQNMFQAVNQLAKQFKIERAASDRSRFDLSTPVNVIPGLHVLATSVRAGTQFDTLTF